MITDDRCTREVICIGVRIGGALLTHRIRSILGGHGWSTVELSEDPSSLEVRALPDLDIVMLSSTAALNLPPVHESPVGDLLRTVVVIDGEADPNLERAARWGANAIVDRDDSPHNIAQAIEQAFNGAVWISPNSAPRWRENIHALPGLHGVPDPLPGGRLTSREHEVLSLLATGMSNAQMAEQLVLSVGAVKFHVSNLLRKFGYERRSQLIAHCQESARGGFSRFGAVAGLVV